MCLHGRECKLAMCMTDSDNMCVCVALDREQGRYFDSGQMLLLDAESHVDRAGAQGPQGVERVCVCVY